ncbi:transcription initiation factor iib [Anaeramoeba flamelloides]|uniref:Transcription initiation factor iib n=1 Tax=Anaeramoeba flamelloides TaxID=1746091 RepID=A0AAV7Z3V4_9EUKA|nr:transcription initiation factor iib [Anaeramoeba flamelloides]
MAFSMEERLQKKVNRMWRSSLYEGWSCHICKSRNVVQDLRKGVRVCVNCATVIQNRIVYEGAEYRQFQTEHGSTDRVRVGMSNETEYYNDLSTTFSGKCSIRNQNGIDSAMRRTVSRSTLALSKGYSEIHRIIKQMQLPDKYLKHAKYMYKQLRPEKDLKKKNFKAVATAIVSYVCRMFGNGRSIREMCSISCISRKEIGKVYKIVLSHLNNKHKSLNQSQTKRVTTTASQLIDRIGQHLNLDFKESQVCSHVARRAKEIAIKGSRHPDSIAAGVVYLVTKMCKVKTKKKITISMISANTGVSQSTIRIVYNEIYPKRFELFPEGTTFINSDPKSKK